MRRESLVVVSHFYYRVNVKLTSYMNHKPISVMLRVSFCLFGLYVVLVRGDHGSVRLGLGIKLPFDTILSGEGCVHPWTTIGRMVEYCSCLGLLGILY